MKKGTVKNKEKERVFKSGEVMSMLEQVNDGIEVIGEQHGEVMGKINKIDVRLDNLEGKVDNLEGKVDNLGGKVGNLGGKVGNLESKFDRMQNDITEIKYKLSEKVDREEFEKLEKRVIKIERLAFSK